MYVSFHFKKGFLWTASTSQGDVQPLSKPEISLFLALKRRGSGRCLTRWSRTCNIPIRPEWREILPAFFVVYILTETKFKPVCTEDVGTRNGKKTMEGNTCPMPFRAPDVVGSNVPGIGKGLRHQEGPTSEKPNAETSWDMLMKEIPNNHLISMKPYEKVRYSPYQLVIAGFLPTDILLRWSSKRRNCKRIRQSLKRRTSCVMDVIRSSRPFGICWSGTPGSGWIRKVYFSGVSLKLLHGFVYLPCWFSWWFDSSVSQTFIVWYIYIPTFTIEIKEMQVNALFI